MNILRRQFEIVLKQVSLKHVREIYNEIDWNERLICIKGARGVGKTTLMCQRILQVFPDRSKVLYVALDNIWFGNHTLVDLADMSYKMGVTHLFLDEVHKMKGWQQQIKNIYDIYGELNIVFTGSSLLEIDNGVADLSRRCAVYTMQGLSFREYLAFKGFEFSAVSLQDILYNHISLANKINERIDVLKLFRKYVRYGAYPFYLSTTENGYLGKVSQIINTVIENDIPAVENVEYITLQRCKQVLSILASQSPSPVNVKSTAEMMGVTHSQFLKILDLLDRAQILRLLYYKDPKERKSLQKPQKILFNNTSLMFALEDANVGKMRETFLASMLGREYKLGYPLKGDLMVEGRYLIEVGGSNKKFTQIADVPDSFLAVDDVAVGFGNKIPIWLFGFVK
ncbi:MAG: ATP-binding protein [Muribaculaceae bacterium]|nr:ATP-binding protein [Muribaculaceae bacterium]